MSENSSPNTPMFETAAPQVTCPTCQTPVQYARFCSNCGANLPPLYTPLPQEAPRHKHSRPFILGILLVIILACAVAGVAGYMYISNNQQSILHAAQNTELLAANQAVNQWQVTCFSNTTDTSNFYRGPPPSGFIVLVETFGIYNPSRFPMDTTWTLTYNYPAISTIIHSTETFHLAANSTSYPLFGFVINMTQLQSFASIPAGTVPQFIITLDGTYSVYGTYSTYSINQHQSYDSSTNTSTGPVTGQFGSNGGGGTTTSGNNNLPKCS